MALNQALFKLEQVDERIQRMEKCKDTATSVALMAILNDDHKALYREQMELLDDLDSSLGFDERKALAA